MNLSGLPTDEWIMKTWYAQQNAQPLEKRKVYHLPQSTGRYGEWNKLGTGRETCVLTHGKDVKETSVQNTVQRWVPQDGSGKVVEEMFEQKTQNFYHRRNKMRRSLVH
jgi:hypothetical protein